MIQWLLIHGLVMDNGFVASFPLSCANQYSRFRAFRRRYHDRPPIHTSSTALDSTHGVSIDMFCLGENPFLESLVEVSQELEKRVKFGASYEHEQSELSDNEVASDDTQLDTHRGVFCGFVTTEEEIQRLKSAHPSDFSDDE